MLLGLGRRFKETRWRSMYLFGYDDNLGTLDSFLDVERRESIEFGR
jgi:hypothetical protein